MSKYTKIVPAVAILALMSTYTIVSAQEEDLPQPLPAKAQLMKGENIPSPAVEERALELQEKKELRIENQEQVKEEIAEKREEMQEKKEEVQKTMEQKKEEFRLRRKTIIDSYSERMLKRLETALERMEQIHTRIQTRTEKLVHMDTVEASAYLETAEEEITQLRQRLEESRNQMGELLTAEDPKQNFEQTREQVRGISNGLRNIHATMTKAVASLRAQVVEETEGVVEEVEEEV